MIITRTPFRISFFGGTTDYPNWCRDHPGAVLNTTINKYCYIAVRYLPPFFTHKYRIRYRITEKKNRLENITHPTVRECLRFMNIEKGIELIHTADIPARSGIGSSSAFTVGLLHNLSALQGRMISKRKLAADAIYVEQELMKESVGCQDQIACAFGGVNRIEFLEDGDFKVKPLTLKEETIKQLSNHIMMFYLGISRTSSEIANKYIRILFKKEKILIKMYEMVDEGINLLQSSDFRQFGFLLNESWQLKKEISKKISNTFINEIYNKAISVGAFGGKLCGSGGGGFLMIFADTAKQENIKKALKKLLYVPIKFETLGSQIIMYNEQDF